MKKLLQTTGLIFAMLLLANVEMAQAYTLSPADGATGVSTSPMLTITFDDNVTLGDGKVIFLKKDGVIKDGFSTGNSGWGTDGRLGISGNTLTINLSQENLEENTSYYVTALAGTILVGGNIWDGLLESNNSSIWSFTTEASTTPITYTLSPYSGETDISTSPILTIVFNNTVTLGDGKVIFLKKDGVIEDGFSTGNSGWGTDGRLSISGNTLTIDLSQKTLEENTFYYVTAVAGTILVGGNTWDGLLESNNSSIWSFTTGAAAEGPIITSVTPLNEATDVSISPTLIVEFDRDIAKGSSGYFKIKFGSSEDGIYSATSGQVSISGNKLTINASGLRYNTTYHVEIDPGFIENYAGLSDPTYWTFTTETKPPQWAENYPTITQSLTGFTFTGKTDVAGTYYYVVTTSNTPPSYALIKAGKNELGTNALKAGNEIMVADVEFSKTILFDSNLPKNQTYYLHIVATSTNGKNSGIELPLSIDRTAPFVNDDLSHPIDGYDLFLVDDTITIVFTEKVYDYNGGVISPLSLTSFTLKSGGASVTVTFSVSEDGREVTLIPELPLSGYTAYIVEIKPLSDAHYNVMPSTVTRTFHTDQLNVWNGNSSFLWEDAGNWQEPYITGKSVLIPDNLTNYPVIDSDITINNFTIEAGAVVTQTGGVITVLGDFELLSSEVTNASYLPEGGSLDVKGETRVHQHIVPGKGLIDYLMGPPTDGTNYANFGTPYLIKYYENPTDSWVSIGTTNMLLGVGYAVYSLNDLIFRGNINRNSIEVPLQRTNGKGYGWNLLGNPYTASINWGDLDVDTSKVENNYWMWDTKNRVYGAFNQEAGIGLDLDGEIPSNHGFLVKLKIGQTSGTFSFAPSAMVVNTKNYLKSTSKSKTPYIKISAGNSEFIDQFAVAFIPDASDGVDKYDTEKFFGNGNPFQIFTVTGSTKLSINSLPVAGEETTINLGYQSSKAGSYTIRLKENYLEHSEVILTDLKEGITVDLLHDGSYTFNVDRRETNSSRFTLTFPESVSTSIKKIIPLDDMTVYLKDGDVIVDILRETEPLTYELVGVSGNIVRRGHLYSGVNNLGKFPSGLYIINTRNDEGTIVSKKLLVTR